MILVDVYIPAVDDNYDFMLDENALVEKVILEITEMIAKKMKSGKIKNLEEFFLYSMDEKSALDKSKTLHVCGVKDGSRLMLV